MGEDGPLLLNIMLSNSPLLVNMGDEDRSMAELDMCRHGESSLVVRTKLSGGDTSGDTGPMPAAISPVTTGHWSLCQNGTEVSDSMTACVANATEIAGTIKLP